MDRVLLVLQAAAALSNRGGAIVDECRSLATALGGSVVGTPQLWRPDIGVSLTIGEGQAAVVVGQGMSTTLSRKPTLLTQIRRPRATSGGDRYLVCKHEHRRRGRKLVDARRKFISNLLDTEHLLRFILLDQPIPECRTKIHSVMKALRLDKYIGIK